MGRGPPSWAMVEVFVPRELGPQGNNRTVECPFARPLLRRLGLPWAHSQEYAGLLLRKPGPPNCRWMALGILPFFYEDLFAELRSPRCLEKTPLAGCLYRIAGDALLGMRLLYLETQCRRECTWGWDVKLRAACRCVRTPQNGGFYLNPELRWGQCSASYVWNLR